LALAAAWAAGFVTFPDRMQREQTRTRRVTPSTTALIGLRLMCHFRSVTLWAWLIRRPVIGVFPQN
jgi:hypothetical protein